MKIKFLSLADIKSDHYVEDNYGVDLKNLRWWLITKIYSIIFRKKIYHIPGEGRKAYLIAEEVDIISWREQKKVITSFAIGLYIPKIKPNFKYKSLLSQ